MRSTLSFCAVGLALLAACRPEPVAAPVVAPAAEAPEVAAPAVAASIYDLKLGLQDQRGRAIPLDHDRGHTTVFSMFYADCPAACPLLISTLQGIEEGLSPEARAALRVTLVSFDPGNDTPELLSRVVAEHHLDEARWTLARTTGAAQGPESDVRLLAAVLGVAYNKTADGGFNHSSVLVLVDEEGRSLARLDSLAADRAEFIAAIEASAQR